MEKPRKRIVNPRFARGKEYANVIKAIESAKTCPFCPENFHYHKNPILRRLKGWSITESSWPYANTQKHLLIIPDAHKELLSELKPNDMEVIRQLAAWAVKKYRILGGGLLMRFGDSDFTGATVSHLHAHLIYPQRSARGVGKTVVFPIG